MQNDSAPSSSSSAYSRFVVGVLMVAYIVSFIDRQIMALLIEPIRAGVVLLGASLLSIISLSIGCRLFRQTLAERSGLDVAQRFKSPSRHPYHGSEPSRSL